MGGRKTGDSKLEDTVQETIDRFQANCKTNMAGDKDAAIDFYVSRMEVIKVQVVEMARDLAVAEKLNEQLQEIISTALRRY